MDAEFALGAQQDLVRNRSCEGADPPAAKIRQGAEAGCVGVAHAEHFAKLIVRDRRRHGGAPRGSVFDSTQADLSVAALDGLVDRGKGDINKARLALQAARDQIGNLDIEADELVRLGGIRFDKGRAAFRIAGPTKFTERL